MNDIEIELKRERENGDRLSAALILVLTFLPADEVKCLRPCIVGPPVAQLTVGHVLDGIQALHVDTVRKRIEL